ncbi:MAG: glycosyltransferase [Candidatus Lokiarchaeota archaeon]|nr:glycosyltransferase [Candidatus Lokiarchaeota archaeon]
MKITIVTLSFPHPRAGSLPGIENSTEKLAQKFTQLGHNVFIITTYWNGGKRFEIYQGIKILRLFESKKVIGKLGSLFLLTHMTFGLNLLFKKNFKYIADSDIIILPLAIGFSRIFKIKKIPVISIFHHYESPQNFNDFMYLPFYHLLAKRQLKIHGHVICRSLAGKKDAKRFYKIKEGRLSIIPDGVDLDNYNSNNIDPKLKKKFGNRFLQYSGLMINRKKISILLKAMVQVIEKIPKINLVLTGSGPLESYYKKLSSDLNIDQNVFFLGYVKETLLVKIFASATLFILPSELEGFGQVIIEALASGTPVICANKKPMSRLIGNAGITFEANNYKDLARKILILLENEKIYKNLRDNTIIEARKYQWKSIAKKYIKYIESEFNITK